MHASAEAARAGEYGNGFAMVAVEVRNLAEQARQAMAQAAMHVVAGGTQTASVFIHCSELQYTVMGHEVVVAITDGRLDDSAEPSGRAPLA